jgi:Mg2+ and Co2+ transporter CorA
MKALTAITTIILPCSLVAAIFTIPAKEITIINGPYDFAIILAIMLITGIGSYLILKYRKWL